MEYDSYFFLVTKYSLMVVGIWPEVKSFKIVYNIYSILVRSYFVLFMVTFTSGTILALPLMTSYQRSDILTYCLAFLLAMLKMFLARKKSIRKLINDVVVFETGLKGTNPDLEAVYKKEATASFKVIMYLPFINCLCTGSVVFASLVDFYNWKALEDQGIESGKRLVVPQLLPYPEKYFDYYYVQQIFGINVGGAYISLVDSLILTLINYTIMRFKMLQIELKNLFKNKERNVKETAIFLKSMILAHKAIISQVNELNENFKWYFFIDFTIKSYQLSLALLVFFDEDTFLIPKHWLLLKFLEATVLFLQCGMLYFQANAIIIESKELSTAIFKSDWIGQPVEIVRCLIIMMVRSQKALKLESFGIVLLSNDLLLKICQASYTVIVLQLANLVLNK